VPSPRPTLGLDVVQRIVAESCFGPTDGEPRLGVELEWLTLPLAESSDRRDKAVLHPVDIEEIGERLSSPGALLGGSRLTFEPGGQLELSSPPSAAVATVCEALSDDAAAARRAAAAQGLQLVGLGMDPSRPPRRVVDAPRYRAMETYFVSEGPAGRKMMCSTAAIQVSIDTGPASSVARRWRLAHDLGPTLSATFANSPFSGGVPSGSLSTRLDTWWAVDPSRTLPPRQGSDYVETWTDYALDARVMLIRRTEQDFVPLRTPLRFGEWMYSGHELGYPTAADFDYHLTTLFPPVRPRGHFELRYIDSLPDPWWKVAVAVAACLLDDPEASEAARVSTSSTSHLWKEASRSGLCNPLLANSALKCFEAALPALERRGVDRETADLVARFHERYVSRGRSPAHDRLDEFSETGSVIPSRAALEESWI
jgi:glutamate--cysteine ligase